MEEAKTVLDAILIHRPEDHAFPYKVDLENQREEEKGLEDDYSFRNRFLKGRRIPNSFVKEDGIGGYIVLSKKKKSVFDDKVQSYHVYKTVFNTWICTCYDFSFNQKPCKHIIKIILHQSKIHIDEKDRLNILIRNITRSEERLFKYEDDDLLESLY